ncbi:MAG: hypothetical protein NZ581_00205 [Candidatus Caldarchaeum sp.]|nr:hypothetical protein [Candidatus Caldarchaeum sp.]MDW8434610.1 hypothetical protein [Candidatus Caldarchaeum sp.]
MRKAVFKSPTPLSSIFSPKVLENGRLRENPDLIGALGGGFSFFPGVETIVEIGDGRGSRFVVNGEVASFPPSQKALEIVRGLTGFEGFVSVEHVMHVPIATGFGTSAAAALGVIMSVSYLVGKPLTLREALKHTHRVEIACKTGLNSEAGLGRTGLVLVLREGSPQNAVVDEIPLPSGVKIVSVVVDQISTPEAIASVERLHQLEQIGDLYIDKILKNPTPENFLAQSRAFAEKAEFTDPTIQQIFAVLEKLPTIGYAQNMVGKAVHALVHREDLHKVLETLEKKLPQHRILVGETGSSIVLNRT